MADINKLKNKARREEQRENWSRAIELYKKALLESERERDGAADLSLFNRIGDIHLRLGDKRQAVQFYEQAIQRYADQDLHTSAIALCNKVLRILPDRVETYRQLGRLQAASGLAADARANFLHYASEMMKAKRTDRALEGLEECAEATGDQEAALRLAGLFVELGRAEEAVSRLEDLRDRLRERGAKVDRLEARLAHLDSRPASAAAGRAGDVEVAGPPRGGSEPVPGDLVPAPSEVAPARASSEAAGGPLDEESTRAVSVAAEHERRLTPRFAAEKAERASPALPPERGSLESSRTFRVEASEALPALPAGGTETGRGPVERGEPSTCRPSEPRSLPGRTRKREDGAERPVVASLEPERRDAALEAVERMSGGLRAALKAVSQRLGHAANGAHDKPDSLREDSGRGSRHAGEPGRFTLGHPAATERPLPDLPVELDGSEPALDELRLSRLPEDGAWPGFDLERPETGPYPAPTTRAPAPVADATLGALETVETGIQYPGAALLEEGRAARAADSLEAAVTAFEGALACPDVFVQAYEALRACREALSARAESLELEAAPAAAEGEVSTGEAELSMPASQISSTSTEEELDLESAAHEAESPTAAHDPVIAGPEPQVDSTPTTAGTPIAGRPLAGGPSPAGGSSSVAGPSVAAGPPTDAPPSTPETGLPGLGRPLGPSRPWPGTGGAAEPEEDPTAEFRQWVDTAPPGLLERSFRELQARGEAKKAALVSDRLQELTPATEETAAGTQKDSGREPSRPPSAEGEAMAYPSEGTERPGNGSANGGTELLEVPTAGTARGDVPLPYDRLEGDATAVDFDELLAELKTSLAENHVGPDTRSRTELGAELKSMGLLDEAIRELQSAVREPSAPPEAYELLGEAFIEKGQPRIAARLLASAVVERGFGDRESLGVLYQLGLAYEQLTDRENALDCYERIFSVDIDYRDIKERILACSG